MGCIKVTKKSLINHYKRKSEIHKLLGDYSDDFFEWFRINSVKIRTNTNEADSSMFSSNLNPARCYGNALNINIEDPEFDYCEGFCSIGNYPFTIVNHGFNTKKNILHDFTIQKFKDSWVKDFGQLPCFHVGVIIPQKTKRTLLRMLGITDENIEKNFVNPALIFAYYAFSQEIDELPIKSLSVCID